MLEKKLILHKVITGKTIVLTTSSSVCVQELEDWKRKEKKKLQCPFYGVSGQESSHGISRQMQGSFAIKLLYLGTG